jgi:tRNA pseudouridine13 synthase
MSQPDKLEIKNRQSTINMMKLKCQPEDFQVTELTCRVPREHGPFALYRLTKRSLGTPEAVDAILQRWNLARSQVSYGGLKDRHAVTTQVVAIKNGPRRGLEQTNLELQYIGQTDHPIQAADIAGNRFTLVMRNMTDGEVALAKQAIVEISADGLPNYFDDQRFGSLGQSGEFIAVAWCRGDYERALWLALAEANEHDRPNDRADKQLLRDRWGDWIGLKAALPRSSRRSIVTYLCDHPSDFRRALALMRSDLRGLWLSAFQSAVWNRLLAATLRDVCRREQLFDVSFRERPAPFFRSLDLPQRNELLNLRLPLPSARLKLSEGPLLERLRGVLAEFELEPRTMRVKYPRDAFFSKGPRDAVYIPAGLQHESDNDELYLGRHKLTLTFELPRGAYATILVKRLTLDGQAEETDPRDDRD